MCLSRRTQFPIQMRLERAGPYTGDRPDSPVLAHPSVSLINYTRPESPTGRSTPINLPPVCLSMAAHGEWGPHYWADGGRWRVGATGLGLWRPMESGATQIGICRPMESGGHTNRHMAAHGEWGPHKQAYGGPWRVGATQVGLWWPMENGSHTSGPSW